MNQTERELRELNEILGRLVKEYNKIANYTKAYDNPSLYDLLQDVIQAGLPQLKGIKANRVIGALFLLLCSMHEIEDGMYIEEGMRLLRVLSYQDEVEAIIHFLIDHILVGAEVQEDFVPLSREEAIAAICEWIGIKRLSDVKKMPKSGAFDLLQENQKTMTYQAELHEWIDELVYAIAEYELRPRHDLIYHIVLRFPFANRALSFLLDATKGKDKDTITLLETIVTAFEISHEEALMHIHEDFYEEHDHRDYVLALDSLAFLMKNIERYKESIAYYERVLALDPKDRLFAREEMLFPLFVSNQMDRFFQHFDQLEEDSIMKRYLTVYLEAMSGHDICDAVLLAKEASELLMHYLLDGEFDEDIATGEELRFHQNFGVLLRETKEFRQRLKDCETEATTPIS